MGPVGELRQPRFERGWHRRHVVAAEDGRHILRGRGIGATGRRLFGRGPRWQDQEAAQEHQQLGTGRAADRGRDEVVRTVLS